MGTYAARTRGGGGRGAAMDEQLGTYEIAYLCGGPERAAQTVLLALHADRRIRVPRGTRRVEAVERDGEAYADDVLQAIALAEIPPAGRPFGQLVRAVAGSPPVDGVAAALQEAGLLSRPWVGAPRPTRRGRAVRRRLHGDHDRLAGRPDAPLARFAALGTAGIAEPLLREVFEAPDPKPERRPPRPFADAQRGRFGAVRGPREDEAGG
ncbi:TIGR04222 domain-containing membrane protein [Spirillospora sp. CA-253888]